MKNKRIINILIYVTLILLLTAITINTTEQILFKLNIKNFNIKKFEGDSNVYVYNKFFGKGWFDYSNYEPIKNYIDKRVSKKYYNVRYNGAKSVQIQTKYKYLTKNLKKLVLLDIYEDCYAHVEIFYAYKDKIIRFTSFRFKITEDDKEMILPPWAKEKNRKRG